MHRKHFFVKRNVDNFAFLRKPITIKTIVFMVVLINNSKCDHSTHFFNVQKTILNPIVVLFFIFIVSRPKKLKRQLQLFCST